MMAAKPSTVKPATATPERNTPSRLDRVRARLDAQLDRIEDVHELEFLEMVASLYEAPFSEEIAVEILLEVASGVARAKARHELALEQFKKVQAEAGKPT